MKYLNKLFRAYEVDTVFQSWMFNEITSQFRKILIFKKFKSIQRKYHHSCTYNYNITFELCSNRTKENFIPVYVWMCVCVILYKWYNRRYCPRYYVTVVKKCSFTISDDKDCRNIIRLFYRKICQRSFIYRLRFYYIFLN